MRPSQERRSVDKSDPNRVSRKAVVCEHVETPDTVVEFHGESPANTEPSIRVLPEGSSTERFSTGQTPQEFADLGERLITSLRYRRHVVYAYRPPPSLRTACWASADAPTFFNSPEVKMAGAPATA